MKIRYRIQSLMAFAILTSFGSSLSAIGTFLALGRLFQNVTIVAIALSLKTLSSVILTRFTRRYALKNGVYRSLLISQISGIPLLMIMIIGFHMKNSSLILLGVFISGIPGNLLTLVFAPMLKELAHEDDHFKKWQGLQQTFLGIGSLSAGLISPWILDGIGVYGLYVIDGITFGVAGLFLYTERQWYLEKFKTTSIIPTAQIGGSIKIKDKAELRALIYILPSFFFTGLIPVLASSGIQNVLGQTSALIERLWMTEAISNIFIGWAYYKVKALRFARWVLNIPLFCTVPVVVIFFNHSPVIFYGAFLFYSLIYLYGFTRYRDDLFSSATTLEQRINHSAFHMMLTNFLRTVSAPVVSLLLSFEAAKLATLPLRGIVFIQIFMGCVAFAFLRFHKKETG